MCRRGGWRSFQGNPRYCGRGHKDEGRWSVVGEPKLSWSPNRSNHIRQWLCWYQQSRSLLSTPGSQIQQLAVRISNNQNLSRHGFLDSRTERMIKSIHQWANWCVPPSPLTRPQWVPFAGRVLRSPEFVGDARVTLTSPTVFIPRLERKKLPPSPMLITWISSQISVLPLHPTPCIQPLQASAEIPWSVEQKQLPVMKLIYDRRAGFPLLHLHHQIF